MYSQRYKDAFGPPITPKRKEKTILGEIWKSALRPVFGAFAGLIWSLICLGIIISVLSALASVA